MDIRDLLILELKYLYFYIEKLHIQQVALEPADQCSVGGCPSVVQRLVVLVVVWSSFVSSNVEIVLDTTGGTGMFVSTTVYLICFVRIKSEDGVGLKSLILKYLCYLGLKYSSVNESVLPVCLGPAVCVVHNGYLIFFKVRNH